MSETTNEFGQPIGFATPDWRRREHPGGAQMAGRLCRLEPIDIDKHCSDLFEAFAKDDGRNWTYLPYGPFTREIELRDWFASSCMGDDPCFYSVIDLANNKAVGVASYLRIDAANGVVEVGHIHFSPLIQGTAIATEAMYLMMRRVFDVLGYRRYEWKCDALNKPSRTAAERFGFKFEGIFRQALMYKQRNRDTAWFAMIDRDWPAVKAVFEAWLDPVNFDEDGNQIERLSLKMQQALANQA
jgi:RimJ/RimL family protein N-acetyltransferase